VIAVEMEPPRGFSAARLVAGAETLRDAGADVVTISDSPMARMRMSPWAACHLVQDEAGIETVLHFPTRGRNLLRIQSDLLAAYALGIRNIFAVMGDSTRIGDFPDAADLADVTPSGLIALVKGSLNAGRDRAGSSIGDATSFVAGCALNPNAADLAREARVLGKKIDAGADFALTQAIFEPARVDALRAVYEGARGPLALPLLAGIIPLVSRRHAEFLHNEVPGIDIPDEIRKRIASATDERAEGLKIAAETVQALHGRVAGIYLVPPFRRYDLAAELVELLRGGNS
jgi:homocysteine S-methyltransferase